MADGAGDHLMWRKDTVAGGSTHHGVGGGGRPVLFLHGWGLSGRSYEPALRRLLAAGRRVYAPSLPGFGGTSPLARELTLEAYAAWAAEYLRATDIDTPVDVIGHSFGGGVGIRLAHDTPDLIGRLVLVNAIGGSAWRDGRGVVRPMAERPLWDWGFQLRNEVRPSRRAALGDPHSVVVSGGHGWLIDDDRLFGQVPPDLFAEQPSERRPAA